MTKFIDKEGNKLLAGTILFDGSTSANFTLNDDFDNYDYIEVIYRPHPSLGQCSDKMITAKSARMHLSSAQTISGVTTIYRCQMDFEGKNVRLTGTSQAIGGASAGNEVTIYRVIGY